MWGRRKPEPVAPQPERTPEEEEAYRAAELECWRLSNPVKTYLVTFRTGDERTITCYYHETHETWTMFQAYVREGWSSRWDTRVTIFKCRTGDVLSIELKSPIPKALRVDD